MPSKVVSFPSGKVLEGVGTSDIPITSSNEKAKLFIRQGFAMIHDFWFNEAIRSFRDATKEDPSCAIAWCGLYAALTQPWFYSSNFKAEAEFAIGRAVALSSSAGDIEQKLIVAMRVKSLNGDIRETDFEKAMMNLIKDHPKAIEPRLLLAGLRTQLCMHTNYLPNGDVRGDLEKVYALIQPILKSDPNNAGALHYHIHAIEPFHPERAVPSAEKIGRAASRSSHMVHMAGHIFNRVGRYEDASKAFRRAREIEEADAKELSVTPFQVNWNYGHNRSFLGINLAQDGKIKEALEAIGKASWDETEVYWCAGDWNKLLAKGSNASSTSFQNLFFQGMRAVEQGDWFTARMRANSIKEKVAEQLKEKVPAKYSTDERINVTMAAELEGTVLAMEGRTEASIAEFERSLAAFDRIEYDEPVRYARLPHESYGYSMLKLERPDLARNAFERGLAERPNNFWCKKGLDLGVRGLDRAINWNLEQN